MKLFLRNLLVKICQRTGPQIRDVRTGNVLGRAWLICWRGRIHVLGAEASWVPLPCPQKRITYWKQEIGFTVHPPPPSLRNSLREEEQHLSNETSQPASLLLVILDHRNPSLVENYLRTWARHGFSAESILLTYGGPQEQFSKISWENKIWIQDPALRTVDHQRDRQSYRQILKEVSAWIRDSNHTHLLFMEYDHLPLVQDVGERYLKELHTQDADVLGVDVQRIDSTIHPHWLAEAEQTPPDLQVWSMLGTGHFWKRQAWQAAADEERFKGWYLEIDLPSSVVAQGYRLANITTQNRYIRPKASQLPPDTSEAWTLHPVKEPPTKSDI